MDFGKKSIRDLSRELRKKNTPAEAVVWQLLRNRKFMGLKFVRQFPFVYGNIDTRKLFFIADFYCAEKKLIIELDGSIHNFQKDYDVNRDKMLEEKGLRVIRFANEEVNDVEAFLEKLKLLI